MCESEVLSDTIWHPSNSKDDTNVRGCNIQGYVNVPRISGSLHFSPGKPIRSLHGMISLSALLEMTSKHFDLTHRIDRLSFGTSFPGAKEPLNGVERKEQHQSQTGMYQYYIKVVRTEYDSDDDHKDVVSNQYSVTEHFRKLSLTATATGAGLPGVYFFYDFSSVMMRIEHTSRSWTHFLTTLCAVVGGVFTVMGLLDGVLERAVSLLMRRGRKELGYI